MSFLSDLLKISVSLGDEELFRLSELVEKYRNSFEDISIGVYDRLSLEEQSRFIAWFLKRWAKIDIVDAAELERYYAAVKKSFAVHGYEEIGGVRYTLRKYKDVGYDFSLLGYDWFTGVHDIYFDQYASQSFDVRPGDVIIDGGAFIGDTAVLFNAKVDGDCEIHAFELFDENLSLLHHNLKVNGLAEKVIVNRLALGDQTGAELSIGLTKLQASMSLMHSGTFKVTMVKLDDYVKERGLTRVDFIKFDIEGAEIPALEGARETIEKFRPRMALCLYHKWDDVITIPEFLNTLSFEYDYEFKWVQLKLGTEGVVLLTPRTTSTPMVEEDTAELKAVQAATMRLFEAYREKSLQVDALWQERKVLSPVTVGAIQQVVDRVVVGLHRSDKTWAWSDDDHLLLISRAGKPTLTLSLVRTDLGVEVVLPEIGESLAGRWDLWLQVARGREVIGQQRVLGEVDLNVPRHFFSACIGGYGVSAYLTESEHSLALYIDSAEQHALVSAGEDAKEIFPTYLTELPIQDDLVFFESFLSKAYAGNPRYIYEELLRTRPDLRFVWAYNGCVVIPGNPQIVQRRTVEYYRLLAQAKYRVSNSCFPVYGKKEGTIYLQTWHGTPLKRLAFDVGVKGPEADTRDALYHESRAWSLLLSENRYSTEVLSRAFRYGGKVLEKGYPVTDVLLDPTIDKIQRLKVLGLPENKRFILYAPTWRDNKPITAWQHQFDLNLDFEVLAPRLPEDCVLLIKAHHLVSEKLDQTSLPANVLDMSHVEDINDLCILADALVTDYSSVMFDFAVTGRPILFYCYDLQTYSTETRGLYLDMTTDLPGPIAETTDQLLQLISGLEDVAHLYASRYAAFQERFCSLNDGQASRRVVAEVFGAKP